MNSATEEEDKIGTKQYSKNRTVLYSIGLH